MLKRQILVPEVLQVLESGIHVPEHDQRDDEYGTWNYAIEGETVDRRRLRVVVAFVEQDDLLVVTVITPVK
jgi:hypothetical protein